MIADLIDLSQSGNVDATLELVNRFNPLLRKYTYRLNFDDAYDELLVDFLVLIKTIQFHTFSICTEGAVVSYIHKSIYNSYIKLSKRINKLRNIQLFSDLDENELYYIESIYSRNDDYSFLDTQCFELFLSRPEASIIKMIFYSGYSISETALICGISRQAVNQTKKRALTKLKALYLDKLVK